MSASPTYSDGVVADLALSTDDAADLETMIQEGAARFDDILNTRRVADIRLEPILDNRAGLSRLREQGNIWATRAMRAETKGIRFPDWVRERQLELHLATQSGRAAPSRLSHKHDLFLSGE
ncbi:MAG: hypothetical protein CVT79_06485 [Alphaproteobacteria bacterium HGW-Alphaproteobacteria-18]|nr:MAG: hypothetical protein CVT79_06485 [Alphaproteobacteria bacterium HGW-Alphaproteobacteria-18]